MTSPMTSTSRRPLWSATWVLALPLLSACAVGAEMPQARGQAPSPPVNIERGLALVQRECASCHAVGASGDSPSPMAPPFRALAAGLSGPALEARLLVTSELGHYEMRPTGLESADIRDVAAYIDSLD